MTSTGREVAAASAALVIAYEELRSREVGGSLLGRGFGLAVMLREGMAAWMEAWTTFTATALQAEHQVKQREGYLAGGRHAEVLEVLASMALGRLEEAAV